MRKNIRYFWSQSSFATKAFIPVLVIALTWLGYYSYYTFPIESRSQSIQGTVTLIEGATGRQHVYYEYWFDGNQFRGQEGGPIVQGMRKGDSLSLLVSTKWPSISVVDLPRIIALRNRTLVGTLIFMTIFGIAIFRTFRLSQEEGFRDSTRDTIERER